MCHASRFIVVAFLLFFLGCDKKKPADAPAGGDNGDAKAPVASPATERDENRGDGEKLSLPFPSPDKSGKWPDVFAHLMSADLTGTAGMVNRVRKNWGLTELWVQMNADGSNMRPLPEFFNKLTRFWLSPNRKKVAYLDPKPSTDSIARRGDWCPPLIIAGTDGSNPVKVHDGFTCPRLWTALEWTTDSTRVIYQAYNRDNWDIFIANADGSKKEQLTKSEFDDVLPMVSPSGSFFSFYSTRDSHDIDGLFPTEDGVDDDTKTADLYVGRIGGGDVRHVGKPWIPTCKPAYGNQPKNFPPKYRPTVRWLAGDILSFLVMSEPEIKKRNSVLEDEPKKDPYSYGIKTVDVTNSEQRVSWFPKLARPARGFYDGRGLSYDDRVATHQACWFEWSPDCSKIIYTTLEANGADFFTNDVVWNGNLPAVGNMVNSVNLTNSASSPYKRNYNAHFSPDGGKIFYIAEKDDVRWLTAIDLASGEKQRLRETTETTSYFWTQVTIPTPPREDEEK